MEESSKSRIMDNVTHTVIYRRVRKRTHLKKQWKANFQIIHNYKIYVPNSSTNSKDKKGEENYIRYFILKVLKMSFLPKIEKIHLTGGGKEKKIQDWRHSGVGKL